VDRVVYKDEIKARSTTYIKLYLQSFYLKKNIIDEIEKEHQDLKKIATLQNELKNLTLKRIKFKRKFKNLIQ
jgi:hypothetical protein